MGDALLETLEAFCSTARIERYRTAAVDDLDAATLYLWNIQLTEAMFPTVAVLEIALRNAVHTALTRREGTAYWFPSVIHPQALAKFRQVEADIHRRSGRGISPEKLVSELSFGFWTSLFTKYYHQLWWPTGNDPLLAELLPNHPRLARDTRKAFGERLDYILRLRNRMMHQEAIFQGVTAPNKSVRSLDLLHREIHEIIEWIDPAAARITEWVDRFPEVNDPRWKVDLRDTIQRNSRLV